MKKILLISPILLLMSFVIGSLDKLPFVMFDSKGNKTNYDKLLDQAQKADIILFGELHDNPICHWLQRELTEDLYLYKKENLILGAEMFESDDQIALNEYLAGKTSEKTMKEETKLWGNFVTDYKPLLDIAKKHHLKFVASNIPRRYANMVYLKGESALDSIDADAKKWIAPFPIKYDSTLKCYREIFENAGGHGGQNLPKSQAYKDATMAHFILNSWSKGKVFIHYNGAYHSNHHQGIEWYLRQKYSNLKILVISSTEQKDNSKLDESSYDIGDFIICTPETMTKTYK